MVEYNFSRSELKSMQQSPKAKGGASRARATAVEGVPNPMVPPSASQAQGQGSTVKKSKTSGSNNPNGLSKPKQTPAKQNRRRSRSGARARRPTGTGDSAVRSSGKSYGEIREAYNIPSNNTLPAGVRSRSDGGSSDHNGNVHHYRRQHNNNSHATLDVDVATIGTGASQTKMTHKMGNGNCDAKCNTAVHGKGKVSLAKSAAPKNKKQKKQTTASGKLPGQPGQRVKTSPSDALAPSGYSTDRPTPAKSQHRGDQATNKDKGYSSDGTKRLQLACDNRPQQHQGLDAHGFPIRRRNNSGNDTGLNVSKPLGNTAMSNGFKRRVTTDGPSLQSSQPTGAPGGASRRNSYGQPVHVPTAVEGPRCNGKSKNYAQPQMQQQSQHQPKFVPPRHRTNGGPSDSSPHNSGNSLDFNASDGSLNLGRGLAGASKSRPGLRSLPEETSFRGSNPAFNLNMYDDLGREKLETMTIVELRAELFNSHGVKVMEGSHDKEGLIGLILCNQKQKRQPSRRPTLEEVAKRALKSAKSYGYDTNATNTENNDLIHRNGSTYDGDTTPANPPAKPIRRATSSANLHIGRRRTNDSVDTANPQQGGHDQHRRRSHSLNTRGVNSNFMRRLIGFETVQGIRRRSSKSSSFSVGDLSENQEMVVVSAPLGSTELSDVGNGAQNPNQKFGHLLRQMKDLEEGMVLRNETQEQQRETNGISSHGAGTPRRNSSDTEGIKLSLRPSSEQGSSRRLSTTSNHSHGTWYVGCNPTAPASPSRNPSQTKSGMSSLKDLMSSNKSLKASSATIATVTMVKPSAPSAASSVHGATTASDKAQLDALTQRLNDQVKQRQAFNKKCICMAFCLLVVVGGALASALIFVSNGDDNTGGSSVGEIAPQTEGSVSLPKVNYPKTPPSDIEGRCSPSNLPGSLSSCLIGCLPSACCYPNAGQESCVDGNDSASIEACKKYRPYCDLFYDPWPGAETGSLKRPPENIVGMCMSSEPVQHSDTSIGSNMSEMPDSGKLSSSSYFGRKRTRHHPTPRVLRGGLKEKSGSQPRRSLWVPTPSEICEQYCVSARCCHAPAHVEGTVISENGVHTDEVTGEYVVTSCLSDVGEDMCSEYDNFCGSYYPLSNYTTSNGHDAASPDRTTEVGGDVNANEVPSMGRPYDFADDAEGDILSTSLTASPRPSVSPTDNTFTMKHTAQPVVAVESSPAQESPRPSFAAPSSSLNASPPSPTIIPASTLDVAAACSGAENGAMILSGSASARANCVTACQHGLCCYAEMLGYGSWMQSCYEGNAAACLEYSPCLVLVNAYTSNGGDDAANDGTVTSESITDEHSRPQENATLVNGTAADEALQMQVQPLATLQNATTDVDMAIVDGPPIPSYNLTQLCSQESLLTFEGLSKCLGACEAGSCCTGDPSCQPEHAETCQIYQPCTDVLPKVNDDTVQDGLASPLEADNSTLQREDAELSSSTPNVYQPLPEEQQLPPAAPSNMSTICSYEYLATAGGEECFETCERGICCFNGSCLDEDWRISQASLDRLDDICATYGTCYNLNLVSAPPSNLDETCDGSTPPSRECAAICASVSCCFSGSTSYINYIDDSSASSPSCYQLFEDTCDSYAPYCNPSPPTTQPSDPTSDEKVPEPPSFLQVICAFSSSFCEEACLAASCCFESSTERSCYTSNKEVCESYSPCLGSR